MTWLETSWRDAILGESVTRGGSQRQRTTHEFEAADQNSHIKWDHQRESQQMTGYHRSTDRRGQQQRAQTRVVGCKD